MKQYFILGLLFVLILCVQSVDFWKFLVKRDTITQRCPYAVRCSGPCPNGFIVDKYGCQTCECNPCKCGEPLRKFRCEEGQYTCGFNKGICRKSNLNNTYCCPEERRGCCPPAPDPSVVLCLPAECNKDADCKKGEKCCGPCWQCVNTLIN